MNTSFERMSLRQYLAASMGGKWTGLRRNME
jgi:hypothetical protein